MNKKMGILTLITFLLCLMPSISFSQSLGINYNILLTHRKFFPKLEQQQTPKSFAVIFDAGSSGTRVRLYYFDTSLDLIRIDNKYEFSDKNNLALSSFVTGNDARPKDAVESLTPLLVQAKTTIRNLTAPRDYAKVLSRTPLVLGGTAGLRLLKQNNTKAFDDIMEAVTLEFYTKSEMDVISIDIISGEEEGAYMWASVNYLMGTIGQRYDQTMGIIELGGASVQMAYALSNRIQAPGLSNNSKYITKMKLGKEEYNLYVHSYLGYGGNEFRNKIFSDAPAPAAPAPAPADHPCRLRANGVADNGTDAKYERCRDRVIELLPGILKLNHEVEVKEFETKAKEACRLTFQEAKDKYQPDQYAEPFLKNICVDLTYQYVFLTQGLKLAQNKKITLGLDIKYRESTVEAAWTLGTALAIVSKLDNFDNLMSFI